MISKLLSITSATALAIILSTPSQANEIVVSGTPGSQVQFTAVGGNALQVTSVTDGFQGIGEYKDPSLPDPTADPTYSKGFAQFGPINGIFCSSGSCGSFQTGQEASGVFPITDPAANQSFTYTSDQIPPADANPPGTPDSLTASITWTELDANAPLPGEPQLNGTGVVNTSSGDAMFLTDFPAGGLFDIFARFPLSSPLCDLTQLAAGSASCPVTFEIAAFEGADASPTSIIITTPIITTAVPEPMSSFMAVGLALFCLWGMYQFNRRGPRHAAA
jgi:hypothetical protein